MLLLVTMVYSNIAKVTAIKGDVLIQRASGEMLAKLGMVIENKDTIKTKINARAQLVFKDNTIISLGKNSSFSIEDYLFEAKKPVVARFKFGNGIFKTITGKIGKVNPKKFKLSTKTASIGIRGTIIGVDSKDDVDVIIVPQGQIEVITPEGTVIVNTGEMVESAVGVEPEVTSIPPGAQENLEQDSGATSNEQESGQGEATQTTELTQEEQEEAKGQNEAEEEEQTEESTQEQEEESEEEAAQEEEEATEEETTQEEEATEEDATQEETTDESQETQTEESTQETQTDTTNDETQTQVAVEETEVAVDEPEIQIAVSEPEVNIDTSVVDDVASVVSDVTSTVDDTTDTTTNTDTTTTEPETETTTSTTESETSSETSTESTTSTTSTHTASMSGYHIVGQTGGTSHSDNYKLYGTNSLSISAGGVFNLGPYTLTKYSDGSTTSQSISNSFTYTGFTLPAVDAYTGHSDISTLSYTKTINSTDYSVHYVIHADNTAEFLVGYTSAENLASPIDYHNLFYVGVSSSFSTFSSSHIYAYKGFKELSLITSSSNVFSDSNNAGIQDISSDLIYINPVTKSMYLAVSSEMYNGAYMYAAGHIHESDSSVLLKVLDFSNASYSNIGTATGQVYGTNVQGLGIHSSETEYLNYGLSSPQQSINGTHDAVHTAYFDNKSSILQTGTATLSGYATYLAGTSVLDNDTFSLLVNRTTGAISTVSPITGGETMFSLSLNGTTDDSLSSYYINDDIFGVLASAGSSYAGESFIPNTGFLISVPDDYNSGNYQTLDDESSWGYWTAKFAGSEVGSSSYNIDPRSTWVAGVETSSTTVQAIIAGTTQTANYAGHVLGAVKNGSTVSAIKFDANNQVNLSFSFGSGSASFSGNMAFHTSNSQQWNANVSGSGSATSFNGSASNNSSGSNITISGGSVNGKYFGTGEIKSVGGKFNFTDGSNTAFGVFKAKKDLTNRD